MGSNVHFARMIYLVYYSIIFVISVLTTAEQVSRVYKQPIKSQYAPLINHVNHLTSQFNTLANMYTAEAQHGSTKSNTNYTAEVQHLSTKSNTNASTAEQNQTEMSNNKSKQSDMKSMSEMRKALANQTYEIRRMRKRTIKRIKKMRRLKKIKRMRRVKKN